MAQLRVPWRGKPRGGGAGAAATRVKRVRRPTNQFEPRVGSCRFETKRFDRWRWWYGRAETTVGIARRVEGNGLACGRRGGGGCNQRTRGIPGGFKGHKQGTHDGRNRLARTDRPRLLVTKLPRLQSTLRPSAKTKSAARGCVATAKRVPLRVGGYVPGAAVAGVGHDTRVVPREPSDAVARHVFNRARRFAHGGGAGRRGDELRFANAGAVAVGGTGTASWPFPNPTHTV